MTIRTLTVCGRVVGSYEGWDAHDDYAIFFHNFTARLPCCKAESGDMVVDFATGIVTVYRFGTTKEIFSGDLINCFKDCPPAPVKESENERT